jgi:hypothetical protein
MSEWGPVKVTFIQRCLEQPQRGIVCLTREPPRTPAAFCEATLAAVIPNTKQNADHDSAGH